MCTVQGKIIIVDFATLIYGHETGRFINILLKLIRQRAWLRRDVSKEPNPVFLWQDEFQYFVTRRDNAFQQTCRSARVAVVCLTQNILNLSEELGEAVPGSKTKAYLGNLMLKIAHQQNDPDSAIYMADLIGKEWRYVDSFNASAGDAPGRQAGQTSVGGSRQLVYRVEPSEFSRLMKPDGTNPLSESVVYFGGKTFNCTVTAQNPKGSNYLRTSFSRDIS
jgi:type IV secretory pathway TraG/TraD family ATPase VirD4